MIVIVLVALRVAGNRDHAASGLATGDERAGAAMAEDDVSLVQYGADIVERQALVHFPAFGAIAAVADLRDHPLRPQTLLPEGFNDLHHPVERQHRAHGDQDERPLLRPASAPPLTRIANFGLGPSATIRKEASRERVGSDC